MSKNIKPTSNIDMITSVCEAGISEMPIQSDINKCRLSQLEKLDKLYINYA